jgi:hypothetical protein
MTVHPLVQRQIDEAQPGRRGATLSNTTTS